MEVHNMPRKKAEVKIKMICEKCGKPQKPSADKSTTNWNVYDCHEKCECGGKFVTKFED